NQYILVSGAKFYEHDLYTILYLDLDAFLSIGIKLYDC
ncbi:hypothetical protein GNI_059770, partial [Gregarina niphandrodes]